MQRIDNGNNVSAAEGKNPVCALKDGDESGEEKIDAKGEVDSTMEKKIFVHDPKLFTGVTPPVETNLFTGVTPPVPQVSHDNESIGKDSNNDGEKMDIQREEDHVNRTLDAGQTVIIGAVLYEDGVDTEKDTETSDKTEGKKRQDKKTALKEEDISDVEGNSNPNESKVQYEESLTNVGEIESQIDQNEDNKAIKNEAKDISLIEKITESDNNETLIVEGSDYKIGTEQSIDDESMRVDQNEVSITQENAEADNNDAAIIEEVKGLIRQDVNETGCKLILSDDYDEKYPAEGDLLPPSEMPVEKPTPNDILFGRGGLTNHHPGNRRFRDIVVLHKDDYMKAIKIVKPRVARKIVKAIRTGNPPGRFLKKSSKDNKWYDVGDRNAAEKASQALREKSQNEKKETKAKAKARYKKEDGLKTLGSLLQYGNMPISGGAAMYGKGGTMMPPFPFVTPAMYGIIPPPGVQMPLLPAMPPFAAAGLTGDSSQFAQFRGDSLNHPIKNAYSKSSESNDKSHIKTATNVEIEDEKDGPSSSIMPTSNIVTNGNVPNIESCQSTDDKILTYPTIGGIFGTMDADGNIIVTDQDILCGRGGATNHHKGNKRFRDIVGVHRPDYVRAPKVQKPGVARLIVKAIRSGSPPGRFLKKCADGKWFDIGDKRAAEKASQALREKPPDERKTLTQANGDYFAFLAQQSAYGMHAGLQGHTYVYPAYPATIVPQQHINPALFMNFPPAKGAAVPILSNGETMIEKKEQSMEVGIVDKEHSNDNEVDGEGVSDEGGPSTNDSCSPSSLKRQKIEICPETKESEACPGKEASEVYPKTEV